MLASVTDLQPLRFRDSSVPPCTLDISQTTLSVTLMHPLMLTLTRPASQQLMSGVNPLSVIPCSPVNSTC
ncbi:hypothetical protein HanRHA438_Chr13g0598741 [Helianthus annuus]|nr:hypothetical protein HanRHA438_Chr13g0598741 [Helianthus annuus]